MLRRRVEPHADALYRDLVAQCPQDPAQEVIVGPAWTLVQTEESSGLMLSGVRIDVGDEEHHVLLRGQPLVDLAELALSWNGREAAVGMAAINAACNIPSRFAGSDELNGRDLLLRKANGAKVGVVGHFPWVGDVQKVAQVTVFEQEPRAGDLPPAAQEYLLPDQDVVVITGSALGNKTLPRLLELSRRAWVMLIGPSTPLSVVLFDYGVDALAGCVARDADELADVVREGGGVHAFRRCVRYVTLKKP